jgi:hypothetical protein
MAALSTEPHNEPINPVLSRNVTQLTVEELLSDIDLENYERAITKYRKPSYQRGLKKPFDWGKKLVESVLEGLSIDCIHLSQWIKYMIDDTSDTYTDEFFNIEDGQTRLNSLLEFKAGKFSTKYGSYRDENIRSIFNGYCLPIVMLKKKQSRIRDSVYFRALNENFSRLQDGTPLSASDRYWGWYESSEANFTGSPLVNYTVELVNSDAFCRQFDDYLGIKDLGRRNEKTRKPFADLIGLISGIWKGAEYFNAKYFVHVPIIQDEISDADKSEIQRFLHLIFNTIDDAVTVLPKYPNERFYSLFKTTQKFTAAMTLDFAEGGMNVQLCTEKQACWRTLINQSRIEKYRENQPNPNWLDDTVYSSPTAISYIDPDIPARSLSPGEKRNAGENDIRARLEAVLNWWVARNV